ncbi:MAG: hypothetical protein AAB821_02825 [Patescibacteria group bacterium]
MPIPQQIHQVVVKRMRPFHVRQETRRNVEDGVTITTVTYVFDNYPRLPVDEHKLVVKFVGNKNPDFVAKGKFKTCVSNLMHLIQQKQTSRGRN